MLPPRTISRFPPTFTLLPLLGWCIISGSLSAQDPSPRVQADLLLGELLFKETQFTFPETPAGQLQRLSRTTLDHPFYSNGSHPLRPTGLSCLSCHREVGSKSAAFNTLTTLGSPNSLPTPSTASSTSHFINPSPRPRLHPLPQRPDGVIETPRNPGTLYDAALDSFWHWDGEFVEGPRLVAATLTGRNYGWLPGEKALATAHIAHVLRTAAPSTPLPAPLLSFSYATLLTGTDPRLPPALRISPPLALTPGELARWEDAALVAHGSELIWRYVQSLKFRRDAADLYIGSPYDQFLIQNRLPRAPRPEEAPAVYARRLRFALTNLGAPRFIQDQQNQPTAAAYNPSALNNLPPSSATFGPAALEGLKIFLTEAVSDNQTSGAGNCVECHLPPSFKDNRFHNTGASQATYDRRWGAGATLRLLYQRLPALVTAAPAYPSPAKIDVGLAGILGNAHYPEPQAALASLFSTPSAPPTRSPADASRTKQEAAWARFKTPTLRGLAATAPYLHNGQAPDLHAVLKLYQHMAQQAQTGKMAHAPTELYLMRLGDQDLPLLEAFMQSLNERTP